MTEDQQWLTVKQFADAAGVSTQRIYQRLAKDLQTYCKEQNGSKYINSDGLVLFNAGKELQNGCKNFTKSLATPLQEAQSFENDAFTQEIARLKQEISQITSELSEIKLAKEQAEIKAAAAEAEKKRADAAEAQCRVKDQQLADQLKAKDEQISSLTSALMVAQQQATDLTAALTAAQALHAGTIQERLSEQSGLSGEADSAVVQDDQSATGEPLEKKRGFFSRIFGKK